VPAFRQHHPEVEVRLRLSDHLLDLLKESVDLAIRMAPLADSSLITRKIADCPRVLCAAPAYLHEHGIPTAPEDLLEHRCLLLRFPGSRQYRWTLRTPDGPVTLPVGGAIDADDGDVLTEWALMGQGIAMKPLWEVASHLREGRLRPLLLDHPPEPAVLAVLYPHRRLLPARVKAFADFMVEQGARALREATQGLDLAALR
jgi:DNA-binding transcriptional LysR family regulator